ncbi:MAG: META domain-containing protein [Hyphomonadaceae bacterium]
MRAMSVALLGMLVACVSPPPSEPPSSMLAGSSWRRIDDENANPHGATLEFSERGASGYTGCNRWFSSVERQGEAFDFGNIGMTRMACQAGVQAATERSFLAALNATRRARVEDGELILSDAAGAQVARFRPEN